MPIEQHRTLAALLALGNLADVIQSGKGEAVAPEALLRRIMPEPYDGWHLVPCDIALSVKLIRANVARYTDHDCFVCAIDAYGNGLCEAKP